MNHSLEHILPLVSKPARYVGGEVNSIRKEWEAARVRIALAFPEVYEIGMSHIGLKILYHIINGCDAYLAERVYAPWTDLEQHLRHLDIPLYALESMRPIGDFDIVGFSLQYEMTYTNVLNMLDLAGIPLLQAERGEKDPIVIAGGPCALNPEPMAEFIDAFVVGEAEDAILELLGSYDEWKREGGSKRELLERWAAFEGVYVPSFYEADDSSGTFSGLTPTGNAPEKIKRRWVADLDAAPFPTAPPVSFIEAVHDRLTVEIMRGCTRGCRFCHAGMTSRPVRERSIETICSLIEEGLANTGYDAVTLSSLSSTDYSRIEELVRELTARLSGRRVSISLPSLRLDSFSIGIADRIQEVRKSGFTFAPEAATDRLRRVINKGYTEVEMFRSLEDALKAGWDVFKLYFMVGLPTETEEDIAAIGELVGQVRRMGRTTRGRRFRTTVSLSAFIPKPHTPFQWENVVDVAELEAKYRAITSTVRHRDVKLNWRDSDLCLLEALLSRGDRRMGRLVHRAWAHGARFDGWTSELKKEAWDAAMDECGIDADYMTRFPYGVDSVLPWDHIDTGVTKAYLKKEADQSRRAEFTADCREECLGCGVCGHVDISR